MNYFYNVLERMRARGENPTGFIDAGAHFGETNDLIRALYPDTRIISFEANPYCEEVLKNKGIEYLICLLGKENIEAVPFFVNTNDITSTGCSIYKEESIHFKDAKVIDLNMYKLDDVIPLEAKMDFLKMDVQGAELDILDGATKLLPTIRWIYLEVSFVKCNEGAPLFTDIFNYLTGEKGYRISDMCDPTWVDNKLLQCNFLFEKV
jgi:FkbM family methyltransferase